MSKCQYTRDFVLESGPGSVVSIVTGYGLDGPGIESRWGRDFPHLSRPALGPTQPPVKWVPGLSPGVKGGQGVTLTPHPLLVLWSRKSRAILYPPIGRTACTEPQCLYKGALCCTFLFVLETKAFEAELKFMLRA